MDTDALLIELIEALQAQTAVIADQAEAINRLADSNQQLDASLSPHAAASEPIQLK